MRDKPPSDYLLKIKSFSLFSDQGVEKIDSDKFEAGGHQCARRFDRVKCKWGFSKFIALEIFKEPSHGYLVENTCFIGAEVYVIRNSGLRECLSISDFPGVSYKYTWTITQFSKLGSFCQSDEFVVGGYNWKLALCPKGNAKNEGCCMSLYLQSVDSQHFSPAQKVKAKFKVTLKDQKRGMNDVTYADIFWFDSSVKCWDCGSFIELKILKDEEYGFIYEDQCVIEAQLTVLYETCQKTLS
ncbi:hypothetical protein DCAR_0313949 [Daucus carota subsp. sativus]|uniref:MATH domain-containing protein n=1 Tax=Daucus carota subsp. sativus TaxID=79200 RepID=A0AAF0WUD4_DAUCS|nr:hypothetical protein DCAR_0313949 [Daucus carota subsp. sativus]